ncbi:hypothetical protein OAD57_10755 [Porticoccaceae bacterium]|nr:hypothetical protein [Porticoccaceae bacterium]
MDSEIYGPSAKLPTDHSKKLTPHSPVSSDPDFTISKKRHPSEGTSPQRRLGLGLEWVKKTLDFLLAKYQGVFNIYVLFSDAI